ncbi:hypothetical protein CC86DRAFT_447346 [Ophiobolus disseminans]|uniref:BZIP domain-containing protein n=1 Tax=Ophiobolus disseminans TaxID=1469910 RepID=A0A6A6ZU01_9PLEO|nr:hypothetical protein CC86DRAFT_447346 [Ophiobolus disseminans]
MLRPPVQGWVTSHLVARLVSALDTPCWAPSSESISLDDFFDFTNGYQDPYNTIPRCNTQQQQCGPLQANLTASSGNPANSLDELAAYGNQSINWDFALFATGDTPNSFPLSSSSAALTDSLIAPDLSLHDTTNWNAFSLASSGPAQYLGDESQLLTGASISFTAPDASLNTMTMSASLHDASFSTPMVKDHSSSGSSSSYQNRVSSPEQSSSRSSKTSPLAPEVTRIEKRKANTMAARRYRQKRVDQMSTLETELNGVKTERDDLKVRCARLEGEVETLRALLKAQK